MQTCRSLFSSRFIACIVGLGCVLVLLLVGVHTFAESPPVSVPGWQGTRPTTTDTPSSLASEDGPADSQEDNSQPQRPALLPPVMQEERHVKPQTERPPRNQLVTVTVTDVQGRYVNNLDAQDFRVWENDVLQTITSFTTGEEEPVSLGLVVDTSASMANKLSYAKRALLRLLDDMRPHDEVFLLAFHRETELVQDFTSERQVLATAVSRLQVANDTHLYAAILEGLQRMAHGHREKKALIILTDGMDTERRPGRLQQVLSYAQQAGVLIYTIGIGTPPPQAANGLEALMLQVMAQTNVSNDWVNADVLQQLSQRTGGQHFLLQPADVTGTAAVLERAAETIARELRLQYSLGYLSTVPDEQRRGVEVRTQRRGVTVRVQSTAAKE